MGIPKDTIVAVIGLGYVGLPLAVEFGKKYKTIGFDLSEYKISAYRQHHDPTSEISTVDLKAAMRLNGLEVTTDPNGLAAADFLIVAVPTPVDKAHIPDFSALIGASVTVGRHLKVGATVIFESTVYPGATEEVCIPVLEKESGLKWKQDFHVGYSPERINPGDRERTITKTVKVVSGDDADTLSAISDLYESVITAGIHRASSIQVAEAAKVIENTQRDLNIALINELAIIFDKLGLDTDEVLQVAGTKWNFLPFRPGLVGGHCIGVDPYYLTYKAEMVGYHPQVILAGRRINDGISTFIAQQTIKFIIDNGTAVRGAQVNVLGLTFKENCPDIRNSKVVGLVQELRDYGCEVCVHDPIADASEVEKSFLVKPDSLLNLPQADALVVAVSHLDYLARPLQDLLSKLRPGGAFIDVKSAFPRREIINRGFRVWRL